MEELPIPQEGLHDVRPGCPGSGLGRRQNQLAMLDRYGLASSSQVLEVGCGIGWLAYDLASRLVEAGGYCGVDVSEAVIAWLNRHYASRRPNFRFDFLDVESAFYRPKGSLRAEHVRFPYEDDQFDIACAFNVFMYLTEAGITNYLREVGRVLSGGGVGLITIKAVIDGDVGARVGSSYKRVAEGLYAPRSGWAMAYDDTRIRAMIDRAGLDTHGFEIGDWHSSGSVPQIADAAATPRPGPDLYVVKPRG